MAEQLILAGGLDAKRIRGVERIDPMWRQTEYELGPHRKHLAEEDAAEPASQNPHAGS
ncbi:hypothetical protein [Streptomyces sp. NPDC048188]|uniref:hypothetical protein n=1 Tax=Streptomyces sp. NPDC048188 TaxID=3155749 RepID=UPI0034203F71